MSKRYIIVEHDNDRFTFEAIIRNMHIGKNIEVESADKIEFTSKSADSNIEKPNGLKESLVGIFREIIKGKCEKIGIIWDLDNFSKPERITQMNNAIQLAIASYREQNPDITISFSKEITAINQFFDLDVDGIIVKIACHFIHFQGTGELEDLLKAIKAKPSPIADCINEHLPNCLEKHQEKTLKDKSMVKLWINHYQRYDTLPKKKRNARYTKWENVMLKRSDIFDFNNTKVSELQELRNFLKMFQ